MSDAYVPEMVEAKAVPGSSPRLRSPSSPPLYSVIPNVLVVPPSTEQGCAPEPRLGFR